MEVDSPSDQWASELLKYIQPNPAPHALPPHRDRDGQTPSSEQRGTGLQRGVPTDFELDKREEAE